MIITGVSYPLIVFFGSMYFSVQQIAIALLVVVLARFALGGSSSQGWLLLALLVPAGLAAWLDSDVALRMMPTMINLGMLLVFGSTLRTVPMIERFARMINPNLNPAEQAHCRQFTLIWCGFFIINAAVSFGLCWAPLEWWALYTGPINYGVMGFLFVSEFLVRRYRFQEFTDRAHDRFLKRLLPIRKSHVTPD